MNKHLLNDLSKKMSLTSALELVEAIQGKKVSRLGFSENHIPWVDKIITRSGAFWEPAFAPFTSEPDLGKGLWSSKCTQANAHPSLTRSWQIYVADSQDKARSAREMEANNDELSLGIALGIPKCCIDFYLANRDNVNHLQNDFTLLSANASLTTINLPFWTNTLTQYFGTCLLSFAPCTYQCDSAVRYAKARYSLLMRIDKSKGLKARKFLSCSGIYTEFNGVYLFESIQSEPCSFEILAHTGQSTVSRDSEFTKLQSTKFIKIDKSTEEIFLADDSGIFDSINSTHAKFFFFVDT